jgi:hypothetical protein
MQYALSMCIFTNEFKKIACTIHESTVYLVILKKIYLISVPHRYSKLISEFVMYTCIL